MTNPTWTDWYTKHRSKIGPSWLQSVEYMYPVYSTIYKHYPPPATLLEIGCGMGDSARALAIMGYTVKAIDNNPDILSRASSDHPVNVFNGGLHFEAGDAYNPPVGFDVAFSNGVIEHVQHPERIIMLEAMKRSATLCAVAIPSPLLCNSYLREMGENDVTLPQLLKECRYAGWNVVEYFGWGNPPKMRPIFDRMPPTLWRRLQGRGKCCLSFCVIGRK